MIYHDLHRFFKKITWGYSCSRLLKKGELEAPKEHMGPHDYQSRALFGWWTVDEAWFLQKNPSEKSCSPFLVIRGTLASGWGILEGRILSAENLTHGQLWIGPTSGSTPLGECGVGLKILGHPQQNLASQASHHCPDDCIWWPFRDISSLFSEKPTSNDRWWMLPVTNKSWWSIPLSDSPFNFLHPS